MNKKHIIRFRAEHNLSTEELGDILGIKKVTLHSYESGRNPMPLYFKERFEHLAQSVGFDYTKPNTLDSYRKYNTLPISDEVKLYVEYMGKWKEKAEEYTEQEVEQEIAPHSAHYQTEIDPIAYAEANFSKEELAGFFRINAIKYLTRYGKKDGNNVADLDKAIFYTEKLKEME
jgi:transcriptional regulator with XRE-family HTH domain